MKNKFSRVLLLPFIVGVLGYIFISNCSVEQLYDGSLWTESALGVIGGTLLATEENIHLVLNREATRGDLFNIFIKPVFAGDCPQLGSSGGIECDTEGRLKIFYNNCSFSDRSLNFRGYWRAYHRLDFPDPTTCEKIKNSQISFDDSSLKNKTIVRHFGLTIGKVPGDENTSRVGADNRISRFYTSLPSGWHDNSVKGGIEVTFRNNGSVYSRELNIKGFHVTVYDLNGDKFKERTGASYDDIKKGASFSLDNLEIDTDTIYAASVTDQTVDTKKIDVSGSGSDEEDLWERPSSSEYVPIVVTGTGANKTITAMKFRVQHNISYVVVVAKLLPSELISRFESEGVALDTNPISWKNDANCCWPTQGEYLTNYYHIGDMKYEFRSTLTKFTSTCGVVEIRYYNEINAKRPRNDDSPRRHTLTQCY